MIEWFEDFALGMKFKSGSIKVTEEDIKRFAAQFDPQPMHLDDTAARETLFKGLAASGWHTAAMAMSLTVQIRPFGPHPLIGLGVDNLRWMMPVRAGDELHVEGEVISLTPSKTKPQGVVLIKWTAFNQKREAVYTLYADRDCALASGEPGNHLMKLFTYWRSQAAYRVRVAMRLKGLPMEKVSLDLLKGDQFAADYHKLNPQGVVPTLIDGDGPPLVQSLAILEYLEEKYPQPAILPKKLHARAHARAIAQMMAMDAHPFMVPRVRKYLEQDLRLDEPTRMSWIRHWVDLASNAVEETLARDPRTGKFCVGDEVTVADLCLAAHLTSAKVLLGRDPSDYPNAGRIYATCMAMEAFSSEHPLRQPDAPAKH